MTTMLQAEVAPGRDVGYVSTARPQDSDKRTTLLSAVTRANVQISVLLCGVSLAATVLADSKPEELEPLPTDPNRRIYYGEYYDPAEYAKCWERWIKTADPRGSTCSKFKERLEPLDPARRETFGESYDPKKYHECRASVEQRDTQCEYLKLRRNEFREYWPYPTIPKPALPVRPGPSLFRWGVTSKQYFDALCKAEAGEFVFKVVDKVQGVYMVRPRAPASQEAIRDRYVMEDPYGYTEAEARQPATIFVGPKKYQFFERPITQRWLAPADQTVVRFFGHDDRDRKSMKREYDSKPKSQYGYTWRGISRPRDREHGIAGGELIVLDLKTNEVLGIRRGFIISGNVKNVRSGFQWEIGTVCPRLTDRPGWPKDFDFTYWFVSKVLRPEPLQHKDTNAAERK